MYHLSHALPLNEVSADNFDLVFLVGGYGAMWDFPDNTRIKEILESFNRQHKPMGFTGHAAAALVALTTADGTALVKGRRLTAFSNSEEAAAGLHEALPFSLETKLTALGALFSRGADFRSYTVTDDNLITGQNPASAVTAALQLLQLAQASKEKAALSDSNKFY
jgi:putative intracellular protease/amidase